MIRNLIFDFGQVIIRFEPDYMVAPYVSSPEDAALLAPILFDRLYWERLDEGTISDEETLAAVRARLPERLWEAAEKAYWNWIYNIPEIEGMTELVQRVKEKYGVGVYLLSNISQYFVSHRAEIPALAHFDGCVFSSDLQLIKPDARIFDHVCRKFDLDPSETLFIDDNQANIAGARAFGLQGYVFDGRADALAAYLDTVLTTEK